MSTLMSAAAPLASLGNTVGLDVGEFHSCFGIDLQVVGSAPGEELIRIDVYSDNPDPAVLKVFASGLGLGEPVFESPRQFFCILKDLQESQVVLRPVPGESGDVDRHKKSPEG